ncbi:MAG: hypothetical protein ACLTZM_19330 [Ruminococcus sp.]
MNVFNIRKEDFDEKYRVLKKGCFLVEFMPEENGENYEYLYQMKKMAKEAGLEYYAKVAWKKEISLPIREENLKIRKRLHFYERKSQEFTPRCEKG